MPLTLSWLGLLLSSGCAPHIISPPEWKRYQRRLVEGSPANARPPQYGTGTIGLTTLIAGSPQQVGSVWVWEGSSLIEGFEVEVPLSTIATASWVDVAEQHDHLERGSDQDFSHDDFQNLYNSQEGCTSADDHCFAESTFNMNSFPSSAPTQPPGARTILTVRQDYDDNCISAPTTQQVAGYVYRVRASVDGDLKWVEHWFVNVDDTATDKVVFSGPDHCQNPGGTDESYAHRNHLPVSGGTLEDFWKQLQGISCTAAPNEEAWCNFCTSNGQGCEHAFLQLDWYQVAP